MSIIISILSILGIIFNSLSKTVIRDAEKRVAINKIISIKNECETNSIYGISEFLNSDLKGYELEINDFRDCEGDPNHGFVNLIPKKINNNPSLHYQFQSGSITCYLPNKELTPFPDCQIINSKKKYRCNDIGDWSLAQVLLNKGHLYLDRDKDGEACEALRRKINKPEKGNVVIKECYDGDTCTTTNGEKIRLACIDTPELRGKNANPPDAKKARDYLNNLISGKELVIRRITEDRYGRTVAELTLEGINIQQQLVENGYAVIFQEYSNPCPWAKS